MSEQQQSEMEWQLERIRRRDVTIERLRAEINAIKMRSSFWHGKYAIVCQENNALRKKLKNNA